MIKRAIKCKNKEKKYEKLLHVNIVGRKVRLNQSANTCSSPILAKFSWYESGSHTICQLQNALAHAPHSCLFGLNASYPSVFRILLPSILYEKTNN